MPEEEGIAINQRPAWKYGLWFFIFILITGLVPVAIKVIAAIEDYDHIAMTNQTEEFEKGVHFKENITITGNVTADIYYGDGSALTNTAGIPSGAVMFFNLSACPSGWTEFTYSRGRYIIGLPSGGTLGDEIGQALTAGENRPTGEHSHTGTADSAGAHGGHLGFAGAQVSGGTGESYGTTGAHTHTLSIDNVTAVAGTNAPYIQLLICVKD